MNMLLCQMGWKEDRNGRGAMFVLGKRIFYKDGQVEEANLAKNVPRAALGFKSNGDIKSWVEMTKVFRMPHMEPLAFAFLAGRIWICATEIPRLSMAPWCRCSEAPAAARRSSCA